MEKTVNHIIIFLTFTAVLCLTVFAVVKNPDAQLINEFDSKFSRIQIGDSEKKVLSVLGEPDSKVYEFRLGRVKDSGKAEAGEAEYFLFWLRGADYIFSIGINAQGRVSSKKLG